MKITFAVLCSIVLLTVVGCQQESGKQKKSHALDWTKLKGKWVYMGDPVIFRDSTVEYPSISGKQIHKYEKINDTTLMIHFDMDTMITSLDYKMLKITDDTLIIDNGAEDPILYTRVRE